MAISQGRGSVEWVEARLIEFLRRMARELFERELLDVFWVAYGRLNAHGAPTQAEVYNALGMGIKEPKYVRWYTRAMLCSYTLETAGESLDRSCQFTVAVFNGMRELEELLDRGPGHPLPLLDITKAMALRFLIETAATSPAGNPVNRRWLVNVLRSSRSDGECRRLVEKILECLIINRSGSDIGVLVVEPHTPIASDAEHGIPFDQLFDFSRPPYLLLDPEGFSAYQEVLTDMNSRADEYRRRGEEEIQWFHELLTRRPAIIDDLASDLLAMRCVNDRSFRSLRPEGLDHVDIGVDALRNAGIESVSFHHEGLNPPDADLGVYCRVAGGHRICRKIQFRDGRLEGQVVQGCSLHSDTATLERLLRLTVIDILHRIMVRERPLTRLRVRRRSPSGDETEVDEAWWVRPTFRRLPGAQQASAEALDNARRTFANPTLVLPPGKTFVIGHWKGGEHVYVKFTEPCFRYTSDDLFAIPQS